MSKPTFKFLGPAVLAICALVAWQGVSADQQAIAAQDHFGFLSVVPALATLAICFATRDAIFALFTGGAVFGDQRSPISAAGFSILIYTVTALVLTL